MDVKLREQKRRSRNLAKAKAAVALVQADQLGHIDRKWKPLLRVEDYEDSVRDILHPVFWISWSGPTARGPQGGFHGAARLSWRAYRWARDQVGQSGTISTMGVRVVLGDGDDAGMFALRFAPFETSIPKKLRDPSLHAVVPLGADGAKFSAGHLRRISPTSEGKIILLEMGNLLIGKLPEGTVVERVIRASQDKAALANRARRLAHGIRNQPFILGAAPISPFREIAHQAVTARAQRVEDIVPTPTGGEYVVDVELRPDAYDTPTELAEALAEPDAGE